MLWYEGVNCLWQDVQRLLDNSETGEHGRAETSNDSVPWYGLSKLTGGWSFAAWLSVIFGASHSPCLPKEGPISSNIESEFHLNIVYSEVCRYHGKVD